MTLAILCGIVATLAIILILTGVISVWFELDNDEFCIMLFWFVLGVAVIGLVLVAGMVLGGATFPVVAE